MEDYTDKAMTLIDTGDMLFQRHGIRRVSVEEICEKAGVSKMTFYKHFKNKYDLAIAVLDKWGHVLLKEFEDTMAQELPFAHKLQIFANFKLKMAHHVSNEFMQDVMHSKNKKLNAYVKDMTTTRYRIFTDMIQDAQVKGEVRASLQPEFIMVLLEDLGELMNNPRLQAIYPAPVDLGREIFNYFLYGITCSPTESERGGP